MQLTSPERIRTALTAFTAALLGSQAATAADSGKLDSSLLIYSEVDRVTLAEGVVDFSKQVSERRGYGLHMVIDVLTGASPNGATPASHVQTFTGASGTVGYVAPAGVIPLDDTFSDKRFALDGSLSDWLNRVTILNAGAHFSWEHDYWSAGINAGLSRDFNRRNTTVGVSGSYSHDTVSPIGGAPAPLSSMPPPTPPSGDGEGEEEGGGSGPGEGKDVGDVVFAVSQVLGRQTLLQVNYSFGVSSGYLTDPYKLLSVVQDENSNAPGDPADYLYEHRPDTRTRQAAYGELRRYLAGGTIDASYRYYWDDWGIRSHAVDFFTYLPLAKRRALEPHVRWYRQSEADFYHTYLVAGQALPTYASADCRLAAFDAWTFGLKYSFPLGDSGRLSFTGEYYAQTGTRAPPEPIGVLSQYELFPALDVYMFRVGYAHGF